MKLIWRRSAGLQEIFSYVHFLEGGAQLLWGTFSRKSFSSWKIEVHSYLALNVSMYPVT